MQLSMYAVEYVTRDVRTFIGILLYGSNAVRQSEIFFLAAIAAQR